MRARWTRRVRPHTFSRVITMLGEVVDADTTFELRAPVIEGRKVHFDIPTSLTGLELVRVDASSTIPGDESPEAESRVLGSSYPHQE